MYVWDADGKRYLDFSGSAAVNFIGHGVTEIATAMADQAKQLEFVHSSQFTTPIAEEYAKELLEFAGKNFAARATSVSPQTEPELHRATTKGVLHKNTVARKLSRLAARINAL